MLSPAEQHSLMDLFPGFELFNELSNAASYYSLVPALGTPSPLVPAARVSLSSSHTASGPANCLAIRAAEGNAVLGRVCIVRTDQIAYLALQPQASGGNYRLAVLTKFSNHVPNSDLDLPAAPKGGE